MKITTNSHNIYKKNLPFSANKMSNHQANFLKNELTKAKKVDIFCHETTDKDSINSALAMAEFLESYGVKSKIILSQDLNSLNIHNKNFKFVQAKDFIESKNPEKRPKNPVLCVDFSSKSRVSPQIANYIQSAKKIYGFDHHSDIDIVDGNYTYITKSFNDIHTEKSSIDSVSSYYVDTSAKSATAIIYRFLESTGDEITNSQSYELFSGLVSDCNKKSLIFCDGSSGTIRPSREFIKDKNSFEIYQNLKSKLTKSQIKKIAKSIDILADLTPEEEAFKNSLKNRLVLSENKKIAYIEIPPYDKEWKKLKGDNPKTSGILNRFRQDVLNNSFNDDNLNDVRAVFVFYRAKDNYRLSAHTKDEELLNLFKYIQTKTTKEIAQSMGGHPSRGGGRILSTNPEICHQWVLDIISAQDFYN